MTDTSLLNFLSLSLTNETRPVFVYCCKCLILLSQWCTLKALWVKLLCPHVTLHVVLSVQCMQSKLKVRLRWLFCFNSKHLSIVSICHPCYWNHFSTLQEQKDIRQQRLEVLSKIEKVPTDSFILDVGGCFFPFTLFSKKKKTDTSCVLQLFEILLEVEERGRMKTTVLPEAEEQRLMQETQRKVEHIYSQLQHHDPLWVTHTIMLVGSDFRCIVSGFLFFEPF